MTTFDRLRIAVHKACERQHPNGIPPLAGQIIVSKCYPPCSTPSEEPFYAVTVVGVWRKDRAWTDQDYNSLLDRAVAAVGEVEAE